MVKLKSVLVNASAARSGGALTILNSFCSTKSSDDFNFYYIISPCRPTVLPKHSKWIGLSTSGIATTIFCLVFINYFYFKFRCEKLISFSNLNSILPLKERVTYFHNILICDSVQFKYKLIRFAIRFFNQSDCTYIFQTKYVLQRFCSVMFDVKSYLIAWPGLETFLHYREGYAAGKSKDQNVKSFIVPIVNVADPHKNFKMILDIAKSTLENKNIRFKVTSFPMNDMSLPDNIIFIGKLSRNDFLLEIVNSDGLLNASTNETLCLPIFESICLNKPAIVLNADYLSGLYSQFSTINGLFVFDDINGACNLLESVNFKSNELEKYKYMKGNWDF